MWQPLPGSELGPVTACCEHGNQPSSFRNIGLLCPPRVQNSPSNEDASTELREFACSINWTNKFKELTEEEEEEEDWQSYDHLWRRKTTDYHPGIVLSTYSDLMNVLPMRGRRYSPPSVPGGRMRIKLNDGMVIMKYDKCPRRYSNHLPAQGIDRDPYNWVITALSRVLMGRTNSFVSRGRKKGLNYALKSWRSIQERPQARPATLIGR